jgi:hypothetical protein
MPSDAADAVKSQGSNDGARDHRDVDTERNAHVDAVNVPHPGSAHEHE